MEAKAAIDRIRARLRAAKVALDASSGTPLHDDESMMQRRALEDLLQRATERIQAVDRASFISLSSQVFWVESDAEAVLAMLMGDKQFDAKRRRHGQDYTNVINYFDESKWNLLLSKDVAPLA